MYKTFRNGQEWAIMTGDLLLDVPNEVNRGRPGDESDQGPWWPRTKEPRHLDPLLMGASHNDDRMITVGKLAAGMAHDFRNVLQTLTSTLELIATLHTDPEAVLRLSASGLRISDRGAALAKRFLSVSRQQEQGIRAVNVVPSVEDVAQTLSRTIGSAIKVEVSEAAEDIWPTATNPHELELALLNLGINARDAMPDGGSVKFLVRNAIVPGEDRRRLPDGRAPALDRRGPTLRLSPGDYVLISVADTGLGMDSETLSKAGQPFFTTKPRDRGTGLGLSIVHNFATQHGGNLRLKSRLGNGTTAEIWLPRNAPILQLPPPG
jgi:signal transduction histidine kinase